MAMKRQTTTLIQRISYRRVLIINCLVLSLMIASFGTVSTALPAVGGLSLHDLRALCSMQFTAHEHRHAQDLDAAAPPAAATACCPCGAMLAAGRWAWPPQRIVLAGFGDIVFCGDTP
ncbi:Macrophage mannose receptor 1 [Manis javanica]|nr:Macrophage mannose receptor 1 [Manis javanica]